MHLEFAILLVQVSVLFDLITNVTLMIAMLLDLVLMIIVFLKLVVFCAKLMLLKVIPWVIKQIVWHCCFGYIYCLISLIWNWLIIKLEVVIYLRINCYYYLWIAYFEFTKQINLFLQDMSTWIIYLLIIY